MSIDDKAKLFRRLLRANLHLVLQRMRVHGFWKAGLPPDPPGEIAERKAIDDELAKLHATAAAGGEAAVEKALRAERIRRWEASKKRRIETKKLRQARDAERRAAWNEKKKGLIGYAGEGVSGGLGRVVGDDAKIAALGLPPMHDAAELAAHLEISLARLRWLTFHRRGAALVHYHRYSIPKKSGGVRAISAPRRSLAAAQRFILVGILEKVALSPEAHGFVKERSIVSNAAQHTSKQVVINLDLKNFFPTVSFRRAKGLFESFGYSEEVATLLSLLATEPPRVPVTLDARKVYVAVGERMVPQGACTSPQLTNLVCRKLDRRLAGLAKRHAFTYTRYADDLTFSGDNVAATGRLLRSARSILTEEGFVEHPTKTRVMRRGGRQEVTGITVNDKLTVARQEIRALRALLHNAKRHGLASQNRENRENFVAHLRGKIAFIQMVDSARAAPLLEALLELSSLNAPPGTPA